MMKLKPLALNEKYESGPGPLQGLGAPGVCRKQSDSGVRGGDQGPAGGGDGTAAGLSLGGLTATPGGSGQFFSLKLRCVLGDALWAESGICFGWGHC